MFSALKKDGQPLYKRARKGEVIDRPARPVSIYTHEILSWNNPVLSSVIACSKGTYIRSIANDLGESVQSKAYLSGLRRTKIGQYDVTKAFTPDEFLTLRPK
jgi:tRNA pseudouridine55 synthase